MPDLMKDLTEKTTWKNAFGSFSGGKNGAKSRVVVLNLVFRYK
jgi:hypothetical protein